MTAATVSVAERFELVDEGYLAALNSSFGSAWDEAHYRWYLGRVVDGQAPSVLSVYDEGCLAAGMGVNYRRLSLPDGRSARVGIFTSAWTLPQFRGRWHFQRLIKAGIALAAARRCIATLSFVTADNPSARMLRRAGAHQLPTSYVFASREMSLSLPRPASQPVVCEPPAAPLPSAASIAFAYRDDSAWREQIVFRPDPTTSLQLGETVAVLEQTQSTDRLQFLSAPDDGWAELATLVRRAQARGRHFFHCTTSETLVELARDWGMRVTQGYIMLIDLLGESADRGATMPALLSSPWRLQCGDRM